MKQEQIERDYAEDVNYWKTSTTAADTWLDKAKREICKAGGLVHGSAVVEEEVSGHAAFALAFELHGERFQIKWPVLQSKGGDLAAAKRQAATALYYDVKAACVKAHFYGARTAFLAHLELPNGCTAAEAANAELMSYLPKLLSAAPAASERSTL